MRNLPVTFFYPYPTELTQLDDLDLDEWACWAQKGKTRRLNWNVQTYLRLRQAGYEVSISAQLPTHGIVVVLPEPQIKRAFLSQYRNSHRNLLILMVRADIAGFRSLLADAEVVQNGKFADGKRVFFVPHWPQPGLIPRDPARGNTIQNLSFKGFAGSLRDDFRAEPFLRFLRERNLAFADESFPDGSIPPWHDYAEVDLVLAVRPRWNDGGLRCDKPASKLVNAWHAGVPALLGPEYAFQELRHSSLDYIEVDSVEEATAAITELIENPRLYRAMIENGHKRAQAFTPEHITEIWAELLFEHLPELAAQQSFRLSRQVPLGLRCAWNFVTMPPSIFEFRKQLGHLLRHTTGDRAHPTEDSKKTARAVLLHEADGP